MRDIKLTDRGRCRLQCVRPLHVPDTETSTGVGVYQAQEDRDTHGQCIYPQESENTGLGPLYEVHPHVQSSVLTLLESHRANVL